MIDKRYWTTKEKCRLYMERMNILLSFDDNYMLPTRVMMRSLARFHSNINLYILHGGLKAENLGILKSDAESYGWIFNAVTVPVEIDKKLDEAPIEYHYTKAMYYRLLSPWIIEATDKILYLDVDTLVRGDLKALYCTEGNGNLLAAVRDFDDNAYYRNALNLTNNRYFNSGVQLIFLNEIRTFFSFDGLLQNIFSIIQNYQLKLPDQDILNIIYDGKIFSLSKIFNYIATDRITYKLKHLHELKEARIVHFVRCDKPWNRDYCLFYIFEYYRVLRIFL